MTMHNPPHPGEGIREEVLSEIKDRDSIGQTSRLFQGATVQRDVLGNAHMWLGRQSAYDLWLAQHKDVPTFMGVRWRRPLVESMAVGLAWGRFHRVSARGIPATVAVPRSRCLRLRSARPGPGHDGPPLRRRL